MKKKNGIRKRKDLDNRCPECESGQVRHRKFLDTWICQKCRFVFTEPETDVKE